MKSDSEYDLNVILALKKLKNPLVTWKGSFVYFDKGKRNESIFEHIGNKKHHLTVKDVNEIPIILKNKSSLKKDRSGSKFHTYIGKRGKKKENVKYLKIVTEVKKNNNESIVTIYLVKRVD